MADLRAIEEAGFDRDAIAYIRAVEAADGAYLETDVKTAINNLVSGLKADDLWDAIGSSCLLCGPRTLAGALVPLRGDAPTAEGGWASGDYDRATGLTGDPAARLYLDSNRAGTADGQNDRHRALYVTAAPSTAAHAYMGHTNYPTLPSQFDDIYNAGANSYIRPCNTGGAVSGTTASGLAGYSRTASASVDYIIFASVVTGLAFASTAPLPSNALVFGSNESGSPGRFTDATIAFYSIGSSLDLAKLDSHVTAYVTAIGAAV
jgi:hypothetical protein